MRNEEDIMNNSGVSFISNVNATYGQSMGMQQQFEMRM